jgi:hypothetical protein
MNYRTSPDALVAHLNGETVVLHGRTHEYYRLNETAQEIWRQLEQGVAIDGIVDHLTSVFDVEEADARAQTLHLCNDLIAAQLIESA